MHGGEWVAAPLEYFTLEKSAGTHWTIHSISRACLGTATERKISFSIGINPLLPGCRAASLFTVPIELTQKRSAIFCVNDMHNKKIPGQCLTIVYVH
jgi:hypothetical protein